MVNSHKWHDAKSASDDPSTPSSGPLTIITAHTAASYPQSLSGSLNLRASRPGPECELVSQYIASCLPDAPRGQTRTLFLEPEIESGFPDVVAVYWHTATAMKWSSNRAELTKSDTRVAHFLASMGPTAEDRLRLFFPSGLRAALNRLDAAGLVRQTIAAWCLRPLREIFAIRRLVAIEAKVVEWQEGLQQAFMNTWFASESYLLLPQLPRSSKIVDEVAKFGVGLRTSEQHLDSGELRPRLGQIPKSYASWLFNEWVWRAGVV